MTEDNDNALTSFFGESAKMEIADGGFSDGVMRRLETDAARHARRMLRVWTALCCIAGLALIVAVGPTAVGDLHNWFAQLAQALPAHLPKEIDPLRLFVPYMLTLAFIIYAIADRERLTDIGI